MVRDRRWYSKRVDMTCSWWDHYKHLVWCTAVFSNFKPSTYSYVVANVVLKNPLESTLKNTYSKSLRSGDFAYDIIDYRGDLDALPHFINYRQLRIYKDEVVDGLVITTVWERD